MRRVYKAIRNAMTTLTIIPMPEIKRGDSSDAFYKFSDSLGFFFLPGVILSVFVYAAYLLTLKTGVVLNWELTSAILLLSVTFLTGFLHIDGVGDVADAFLSTSDKGRILDILKDSRMGTFGVTVVFFDLLMKWLCWTELLKNGAVIVIFISLVMSRSLQGVFLCLLPNARESGTAGVFSSNSKSQALILIGIMVCETAVFGYFIPGFSPYIIICIGFVSALVTSLYFLTKIGGITGDCIGAMNEVFEISVLVTGVLVLKSCSG